jgi:hypothetical protein
MSPVYKKQKMLQVGSVTYVITLLPWLFGSASENFLALPAIFIIP